MKRALFVVALLLAGCVSDGRSLRPGVADAAAVRAEMGPPAEVDQLPEGGEAWFYPRGRIGRQTFRAEIGADGRLRKLEQVLDEEHFDRVVARKTTREELRRLLGPPNIEQRGSLSREAIWEYRYYLGAQRPWIVRFGIDDRGVVTGQARLSEENGPADRM